MNIKRFSNFPQSIDPVKSQTILEQFLELNNNFGVLNENLQAIDANFEQVQEEFATLENEFAETQRKVNSLESEIGTLPAQVAQNTSDITQNTSDIAELKQREDKQGTIVKVNGQPVAQWSPDTMSTDIATNRDNIQQVTQAQASDSLAIVGLQSDNITNKQNISSLQTNVSSLNSDNTTNKSNISALQTNVSDLQGDVTTLNQQQARSLKTPTTAPTETELVGVDSTNSQVLIPLSQIGGGGAELKNELVTTLSDFYNLLQTKDVQFVDIWNTSVAMHYKTDYKLRLKTDGTITQPTIYEAETLLTPLRYYMTNRTRPYGTGSSSTFSLSSIAGTNGQFSVIRTIYISKNSEILFVGNFSGAYGDFFQIWRGVSTRSSSELTNYQFKVYYYD